MLAPKMGCDYGGDALPVWSIGRGDAVGWSQNVITSLTRPHSASKAAVDSMHDIFQPSAMTEHQP